MNNNIFDKNRFAFLLLRQIQLSGKGLIIGAGSFIGFSVFIMLMPMLSMNYQFNTQVFLGTLLPFITIIGYIFTSTIFAELNSPQKSYLYLTLPASTTEKLTVAWFTSSILYLALAVIVMFIINILLIIIDQVSFSRGISLVNLFNKDALLVYGNYLVTQSIFLLGAIYFRKLNFLKTVLTLIITGFAIALYSGLLIGLAKLILSGNFEAEIKHFHISSKDAFGENTIALIGKILYWGCTAPFFIIVSYFSLKERQV